MQHLEDQFSASRKSDAYFLYCRRKILRRVPQRIDSKHLTRIFEQVAELLLNEIYTLYCQLSLLQVRAISLLV